MRKRIKTGIVILMAIFFLIVGIVFYNYKQVTNNMEIMRDITIKNSDSLVIYVNIVLPEEKYHKDITMNAIRVYMIVENRKIPYYLTIALYDNQEELSKNNSYADKTYIRSSK